MYKQHHMTIVHIKLYKILLINFIGIFYRERHLNRRPTGVHHAYQGLFSCGKTSLTIVNCQPTK